LHNAKNNFILLGKKRDERREKKEKDEKFDPFVKDGNNFSI
jgi:hypothetical protein